MQKQEKKVNCYRVCKRKLRSAINWNKWSLKMQMRIHLITILISFFVIYFAILIGITRFYYRSEILSVVSPSFAKTLNTRLDNFSKSVATSLYHMDQLGILQSLRVSQIYQQVDIKPSPLVDSAFSLVPQSADFSKGQIFG